jgi:hypothetical protein
MYSILFQNKIKLMNILNNNWDSDFHKNCLNNHTFNEIKERDDVLKDYPHKDNLVHFFQEKGQDFNFPIGVFPVDVALQAVEQMQENQCHWNSLLAYKTLGEKPNIYVCYGFVDGYLQTYNSQEYVETVQHSFVLIEKDSPEDSKTYIYDPTLALINLKKQSEDLTIFKNYFGVKLSRTFLEKHLISPDSQNIIPNVSWYLKEKIFPSLEKTDEVLKLL